jgi:TolA-binding protein
MCKFFKWLHKYGEYLAENRIPASGYVRTIEELHRRKVESIVNQEQEHHVPVPNVQIRDLIEEIKRLRKDLDEERCKRGMEQQVNNARFQMLENEAKGRGMGWFRLFLWFLSVLFAMFFGGAMEFAKSN